MCAGGTDFNIDASTGEIRPSDSLAARLSCESRGGAPTNAFESTLTIVARSLASRASGMARLRVAMRPLPRPNFGQQQLGVPQHQPLNSASHAGVGGSGSQNPALTRAANGSTSITEEFTIKVIAGLLCASVIMVLLMIIVLIVARYRLRSSEQVAKGL